MDMDWTSKHHPNSCNEVRSCKSQPALRSFYKTPQWRTQEFCKLFQTLTPWNHRLNCTYSAVYLHLMSYLDFGPSLQFLGFIVNSHLFKITLRSEPRTDFHLDSIWQCIFTLSIWAEKQILLASIHFSSLSPKPVRDITKTVMNSRLHFLLCYEALWDTVRISLKLRYTFHVFILMN